MKFDYKYSKLSNGVRSLIVPMPGVESVTALVLVKTGSRNETDQRLGISHILEHMMLKASKKYPNQMVLSSTIDSMGAQHNAFTGKEYTGYYITASAKHLATSLDILGDVITNPLLKKENLKTELGVIVEEINMYEDLPMERALEEFENLIYEGNKLGRLIIGSKESVLGTKVEHLREYLKDWYQGGNILVVLSGKVAGESGLVEEKFGEIGAGEMREYVEVGKYGSGRESHIKRETEQAHFVMGVPAMGMSDPRRYALQLAQVALGGNMSSRLFNEIREKRGLAYYVRAVFDTSLDVGYFGVRAGVKLDKLGEAIAVVKREMLKLGETMSEEELQKSKDYLLGKLPLTLEGSMEVAQFMGMRALMTDEVRQPEEVVAMIEKVSLDNVRDVLREVVIEDEIRTTVVGPSKG